MIDPDLKEHKNVPRPSIGVPGSLVAAQRLIRRWFAEPRMSAVEAKRLEKQIKDFAGGGITLIPQRQGIYLGALILTSYFFNFKLAILCYLFCQLAEVLDNLRLQITSFHLALP